MNPLSRLGSAGCLALPLAACGGSLAADAPDESESALASIRYHGECSPFDGTHLSSVLFDLATTSPASADTSSRNPAETWVTYDVAGTVRFSVDHQAHSRAFSGKLDQLVQHLRPHVGGTWGVTTTSAEQGVSWTFEGAPSVSASRDPALVGQVYLQGCRLTASTASPAPVPPRR
jgi:hypothetical protein